MNDDIGFRHIHYSAWDIVKKEWITKEFHIIGEVTVFDMIKQYRIENFNDIAIIEGTGIKDSKGIEIYEGDIIKYSKIVKIVKWNDHRSGFYLYDKGEKLSRFPLHREEAKDFIIIIGNFFENKDLISG